MDQDVRHPSLSSLSLSRDRTQCDSSLLSHWCVCACGWWWWNVSIRASDEDTQKVIGRRLKFALRIEDKPHIVYKGHKTEVQYKL